MQNFGKFDKIIKSVIGEVVDKLRESNKLNTLKKTEENLEEMKRYLYTQVSNISDINEDDFDTFNKKINYYLVYWILECAIESSESKTVKKDIETFKSFADDSVIKKWNKFHCSNIKNIWELIWSIAFEN